MSTESEPVVSLEDVSVHFESGGLLDRLTSDGGETVHAVSDVDLDIHENDVVALVGESGCGKTTLGKTTIGLQRPTGGRVLYRGQDFWETKERSSARFGFRGNGQETAEYDFKSIRKSLQIIHQDPGSSLNPNRTVLGSLSEPLKNWYPEINPDEREERIYELLGRVGMTPASDYANRFPHQLSGGEKQRAVLARTLLMEPDLVLADEAVSALDVSLRVEMMDLMLELQDLVDTSYLFISHDFANARYLAGKADGRIGVMYLGRLVEIGPAQQVIDDPKHPYTKVLKWATPALDPDLARDAHKQDPPIREIDIPDPVDPPSGCSFHPRCPEAREVCPEARPPLIESETDDTAAACYRVDEDHEYWNSQPLE